MYQGYRYMANNESYSLLTDHDNLPTSSIESIRKGAYK